MADQPTAQPQQPQPGQQIQVPIDDTEMENVYVNFFRVSGNTEELFLDVGFLSQLLWPTGPEAAELTHRLILNFANAKRLAEFLRTAVARHEQQFGVVETDPSRRIRQRPPQG